MTTNPTPTNSSLTPPRLVTTSHSSTGKSIISFSDPAPTISPFGPQGSSFSILHSTPSLPATLPLPQDSAPPSLSSIPPGPPRCPPAGAMFVTSDIPPGGGAPLHKTASIDYAAVLVGEIVLTLEGGEEAVVKAGECIVQGGTVHGWRNRGSGVCRVLFVMIGAREEGVQGEEGGIQCVGK